MSAIGYKGTVTIVKRFKGKYIATEHYHNNGTPELFKYLCRYLWNGASSSEDKGGIPYYLDVAQAVVEEGKLTEYRSILNSKIFTYEAEGINGSNNTTEMPSITKVFYLTHSSFRSDGSANNYPLCLLLYHSADADMPLATIPLAVTDANEGSGTSTFKPLTTYSIAEGESHEIMWKMEFENYEDTTLVVGGGKN